MSWRMCTPLDRWRLLLPVSSSAYILASQGSLKECSEVLFALHVVCVALSSLGATSCYVTE